MEVASGTVDTTDMVDDSPLLLGNWSEAVVTVSPFQGQIEEVAVWGTARTLGQVVADFDGIDPAATGLAGHWKLNEASGDAVLERLEMPSGIGVSGLESDGADLFYCGGGATGKVRAVRRPKGATK